MIKFNRLQPVGTSRNYLPCGLNDHGDFLSGNDETFSLNSLTAETGGEPPLEDVLKDDNFTDGKMSVK